MPFNISEFSAAINKGNGLAVNNLFMVRITPPRGLILGQMGTEDLVFFCRSADIPNISIQTADIFNQGFGSVERRATGIPHEPLNTIFMVDGNFGVKRFFHRWTQLVVNYNDENYYATDDGKLPYEVGYKDDYTGTIELTIFNNNNNSSYTYTFRNAYPTSVGNISVAWENSAEILTMPITFHYDSMANSGMAPGIADNLLSRVNGILYYLTALNTHGIALDNIESIKSLQDLTNKLANLNNLF